MKNAEQLGLENNFDSIYIDRPVFVVVKLIE